MTITAAIGVGIICAWAFLTIRTRSRLDRRVDKILDDAERRNSRPGPPGTSR